MTDHETAKVVTAVEELLADGWRPYPGGYPGQIELALIDAVFSIRARYGQAADEATGREATGVRAVVDRWRKRDGAPTSFDDLGVIASTDVTEFTRLLQNRSVTSRQLKSEAVHQAADRLAQAGIRTTADFRANLSVAKREYTAVRGLGRVTFSYLGMLLGVPDVKSDVWITRFVGGALSREVGAEEARRLLHSVAEQLTGNEKGLPTGVTELDHAIWFAMSQRQGETGEA